MDTQTTEEFQVMICPSLSPSCEDVKQEGSLIDCFSLVVAKVSLSMQGTSSCAVPHYYDTN